ncbi:hypothetical protein JF541_12445 [Marinobacter hydrocarbonoclasticus]|uniref:hypothetical protein n=1 Tax=Marinobacter nauticus TaxID=2743 RepID=UPI001A8E2FE4|nr:hypothetical protein [Marinobacter nauticus]MBN8239965.1 hypothetical protein [Marinobacter nauticus]
MSLAKFFTSIALVAVLLLVVVINFSAVEERYRCEGSFANPLNGQISPIYLKIHDYRWWVGLWSDSDAAVWLEVPNEITEYYGQVKEVGDKLQLYGHNSEFQGSFSNLSKALQVELPRFGRFSGACVLSRD